MAKKRVKTLIKVPRGIKNKEVSAKIPGLIDSYTGLTESVMIDVDMVPIVKILVKKGYFTLFCCSGHHNGKKMLTKHGYIYFKVPPSFKNVPEGIYPCELGSKDTTIRWESKSIKELNSNLRLLKKWASSLPTVKDING